MAETKWYTKVWQVILLVLTTIGKAIKAVAAWIKSTFVTPIATSFWIVAAILIWNIWLLEQPLHFKCIQIGLIVVLALLARVSGFKDK